MEKTILKTSILFFILVAMQISLYSATDNKNIENNKGGEIFSNKSKKKILIAYYSRSGNTKEIANQIHKVVGGDLLEIQTVDPYPSEYEATTKQAKDEINRGYKPAIKTKINNINEYDIIFIGSPNWWSTIAPALTTFLSENDLSGKTIIPFITHGSGGLANCVKDIAKLSPKSTILDGKAFSGSSVKTAQNDVSKWLNEIEILK